MKKLALACVGALLLAGCAQDIAPDDEGIVAESALDSDKPCREMLDTGCVIDPGWESAADFGGSARNTRLPAGRAAKEKLTPLGKVAIYVEDGSLVAYLQTSKEVMRLGAVGEPSQLDDLGIRTTHLGYLPAVVVDSPMGEIGGPRYYFAIPRSGAIQSMSANIDAAETDMDGDGRIEVIASSRVRGNVHVARLLPGKGFEVADAHAAIVDALRSGEGVTKLVNHPRFGHVISFKLDPSTQYFHFKLKGDKLVLVD